MHIVVVGGGFGGVKAALELAKRSRHRVTLISDRDHLLFYPLLYSTATGKSIEQSVISLRTIFYSSRVRVVQDTITSIDTHRKIVVGAKKQYQYDRVIFALGVVTSYFHLPGLDTYSYGIKSSYDVMKFRDHLHTTLLEDAKLDKNYIVVGAGPTGVELAASLASYLKTIAKRHNVRNKRIRLLLVEAAPRVLPRLSVSSSKLVQRRLKKLGVRVMVNKKVESEDDDGLFIDGKELPTKTVIWTSGVSNHPLFSEHDDVFSLNQAGKVIVDDQLQAAKDVYVIGDNASTPFSGLAQTAVYDGKFVAKLLSRRRQAKKLPKYRAHTPFSVVPVGANWAIMEYKSFKLWGLPAGMIRKCADLVAYLDLFPLPYALHLWLNGSKNHEYCSVCKNPRA